MVSHPDHWVYILDQSSELKNVKLDLGPENSRLMLEPINETEGRALFREERSYGKSKNGVEDYVFASECLMEEIIVRADKREEVEIRNRVMEKMLRWNKYIILGGFLVLVYKAVSKSLK